MGDVSTRALTTWMWLGASVLLAACGEDKQTGTAEVDTSGDTLEVFVPDTMIGDTTVLIDIDTAAPDTAEPDTSPPKPGEFGYGCNENLDCNSGWCIQTVDGRQCTRTCLDECPPNYDCREAPGTDATFICLPRFLNICDPCRETADCNRPGESGNYCLSYAPEGRFCGVACETDSDCPNAPAPERGAGFDGDGAQSSDASGSSDADASPADASPADASPADGSAADGSPSDADASDADAGTSTPPGPGTQYVCRNVPVGGGGEAKQCVPVEGTECTCSPLAKQLQKATVCENTNEHGTCEGTRFCLQSGLSSCDAKEPLPESCNKLDDNCNGATDEFPPDYVCQITNEFGSCPGKGSCVDGVETCEGTPPAPDICDLIDNDCDGVTDNGLCDDLNPCTTDSCDPNTGNCIHVNDNTMLCDDGNVCTQLDKCQDGVCVGYNPKSCEDNNPCTTNVCDPTVGCLSSFNNAACEDGNPCTINDTCNQGVCVSGGPNTCDDGNACTDDSCQPGVGCQNTIDDTNSCNVAGLSQCKRSKCQAGQCIGVNNDGVGCTTGSSDCPAGTCNGGSCRVNQPQTCNYDPDFCEADVPGTCSGDGSCIPSQNPSCQCGACPGICVCCQIGPIPLAVCIPF